MCARNEKGIQEFLEQTARMVDRKIEEYIPRSHSRDSLFFQISPPRFRPDFEALDKTISEPTWEFLERGGKRWRPALFLLVLEALGGNPEEHFDFAIIPEVIHNGTLIADDVEDASELRRGKPCTHRIFGVDVAINVSDALFFLPMLVMVKNRSKMAKEKENRIYETFVHEMISLCLGQAMDIAWHSGLTSREITEQQYLQMCIYKTGTLARMAAKMAAVLAGAGDEAIEKIGRLAESLGVSFQIQDDILDIVGKEFAKGKGGLGRDISEGKRSLLVIHALENAPPQDKRRLKTILDMHTSDEQLRREAIDIIEKYGSVEYAKEVAQKLMHESLSEVDEILPPSKAKSKLISLANYLVQRNI